MAGDVFNCLWFGNEAEEAASRFVDIFGGRIIRVAHNPPGSPAGREGSVLTVEFEILGRRFLALNGGQRREYTEAMSLMVECDSQAELDRIWTALIADGGREMECGWCVDRYGIRWQIIPKGLPEWIGGPNAPAVFAEVWAMKKLDVARLRAAASGTPN